MASGPQISSVSLYLQKGWWDKHPIPVANVNGHRVTYLQFFHYITLIRASDPKKISASLYLQLLMRKVSNSFLQGQTLVGVFVPNMQNQHFFSRSHDQNLQSSEYVRLVMTIAYDR